jgi:hypothetical protein
MDKEFIHHCVGMIQSCRQMITAANEASQKYPSLSELASEVIELNRSHIRYYSNEIRRTNEKS